jgi:rubrerythrin
MLSKQELISLLEESLKTEESAIPLYTKHVSSTLFLSDISKDKKVRIYDILEELNTQSSGHAVTFKQMINDIQGDDRNVY